jgi:hypothetical protein
MNRSYIPNVTRSERKVNASIPDFLREIKSIFFSEGRIAVRGAFERAFVEVGFKPRMSPAF